MKERFGSAAGFIFIYTEDKTLQCYGQIPEAGEFARKAKEQHVLVEIAD